MCAALVVDDVRPCTGGWVETDPAGNRLFEPIGDLVLESGRTLPQVVVAYEMFGQLDADHSNVVLLHHALTGDTHVAGPAGEGHATPGWWDDLVGPGKALDTERLCVIAPAVLGGCQGTTGPASLDPRGERWGSRFPAITIRDQVRADHELLRRLGIDHLALVLGGSMGGMRALEYAATWPEHVGALAVVAATAVSSADQIGWNQAQTEAIRMDPHFEGGDYYDSPGPGPVRGLGLARRIAHLTYRTGEELELRFGNRRQHPADPRQEDSFAVTSYLDHHAVKLVDRFDANAYLALVEAMDSHDIGRGRGGVESALGRVRCPALVVAIDSDRLFPVAANKRIARALGGPCAFHLVESLRGHDGFLVESATIAQWVADLVNR